MKKGCHVYVCTEEFTSKTYGSWGNQNNDLGSTEVYNCKKYALDRDVNGAGNIFIKI